ncbi:MAG TPA: hypothetical protein DDZ40_00165 [Deltaproteobacteria bacterium]|nr:hypothetical protein [Deltaproteobacteria bacterium]
MFIKKILFDWKTDRLGPGLPFTHWMLYFRPWLAGKPIILVYDEGTPMNVDFRVLGIPLARNAGELEAAVN